MATITLKVQAVGIGDWEWVRNWTWVLACPKRVCGSPMGIAGLLGFDGVVKGKKIVRGNSS